MRKSSKKTLLVNTFGALGYASCLLLWAWIGIVFVPLLLENEQLGKLLLPAPSQEPISPTVSSSVTSPLVTLFAFIVTIAVIVLTIIVLLRAPVTIIKTGKTVTTKAATSALPLVTKGRTLPPAERRRLTVQLIKVIKLLLVILPVTLSFLSLLIETPIIFELVILVSALLALAGFGWFCLQYAAGEVLGISSKSLV